MERWFRKLSFLSVLTLLLVVAVAPVADAGHCQVYPSGSLNIVNYASWGCGSAGIDAGSIQATIDDRLTDGSCVYLYGYRNGGWYYTGYRSCGSPVTVNTALDSNGQSYSAARIYRFPSSGTNYLTLQLSY